MATKTKNKKIVKQPLIRKVILIVILILIGLAVFYPFKSRIIEGNGNSPTRITDIVVYPQSNEKLYTKNEDRVTINYQTSQDIDYRNVISFYKEKMPKLGWTLISSSDFDAVFEKDTRRVRVWILYTDTENVKNAAVDYIIDYSSSQKEPPPAI